MIVAPGVALTCLKGVLEPGAEVKPEMLSDPKAFDVLADKGLIIEKPKAKKPVKKADK